MVLLSIFFTESDPRRDHQQIVLPSFVAPCACSSSAWLNISKSFCMKIWALTLHTSVSCISLQNTSRTHFVTQPILLSENIPNIWHKSSTKHRRLDQIETIKTIMQTTRPRITWKVLPMAQVAIFKEIFDQVRKDLDCELFYSELKRHNVSLYLLSSHR